MFVHPLGLPRLHPGNPAVTTKECTHELTFAHISPPVPHRHTNRQITPRHVPSNIPLYKEVLRGFVQTYVHCAAARHSQDRQKAGGKKKNEYSTAAFLTKSELRCDCLCLLLLLPLEGLPITLEKRSQRKEKKKEKKNIQPPLPVPSHPAQPDFSPSSVHFLNKPETVTQREQRGRGVSQKQFLITRRQGETI